MPIVYHRTERQPDVYRVEGKYIVWLSETVEITALSNSEIDHAFVLAEVKLRNKIIEEIKKEFNLTEVRSFDRTVRAGGR